MDASSEVSGPSTPVPVGQQAQNPKEKNVNGQLLGAVWQHFIKGESVGPKVACRN
jgi:hypothetical protein